MAQLAVLSVTRVKGHPPKLEKVVANLLKLLNHKGLKHSKDEKSSREEGQRQAAI